MYQPNTLSTQEPPPLGHLLTHLYPFFSSPFKPNRDPKSAHHPVTPPVNSGQPSEHHKVNDEAKNFASKLWQKKVTKNAVPEDNVVNLNYKPKDHTKTKTLGRRLI